MLAVILVAVPYAAAVAFFGGFARRAWVWATTPVPFNITTTTGQQKSLAFLENAALGSPAGALAAVVRVALELLLFRSLFRDASHRRRSDGRLVFPGRRALWAASLLFHWSLLVIVVRHLRLVAEPVPAAVTALARRDAFVHVGTPAWYATDVAVAVALAWLLLRRLRDPLLRYLTLPADYLALGVLLAIVVSGLVLRYVERPDIVGIKSFALALVSLRPGVAAQASRDAGLTALSPAAWWFTGHVVMASVLVAIFPFTKLMHAAAAFLVPTRSSRADSRRKRHVNPWNAPVKVRTRAEWEEEFKDKIAAAGIGEPPAGGGARL